MTDRVVMEFAGGVKPGDLLALQQPTPPDEIKWRKGPGGKELAYVDARWVMERLDEVIGPANWSRKHIVGTDGRVACGIGILVEGVGWVEKWDGAGETDIEGQKGSFSDAFKRAAVSWGLARDLYSLKDRGSAARTSTGKRQPHVSETTAVPQQAEQAAPVEQRVPPADWADQAAASVDAEQAPQDWSQW